jgi:hypothetical protein
MTQEEYKKAKLEELDKIFPNPIFSVGEDDLNEEVKSFLSSTIDEILECLPEEMKLDFDALKRYPNTHINGFNFCLSQFLKNLGEKLI